ncbi:MAG: DUF4384 domain-containing protein [Myxococcales bacterium]
MNRHPSELALEAYLFDRETSPFAVHVGGCERCRARVARMEREGEDFRRFVLPATLDAVLEKNAPERRKKWLWALGIAPVAAVAALIVAIRPAQPPDDYVGPKGGMSLVAYLGAPGGAKAVRDGQAVNASAPLRFSVAPQGRCNLWIVSVDESAQISRIYPAQGDGGAPVARQGALPGGAVLDGRAGLERFYAVCSPNPLGYDTLTKSVRASVHRPDDVRKGPALAGLPKGTRQTSLLVEKRP